MKKTVSFSKNSSNLFFHILTKCNLNCRHCYINHDQHGDSTLSLPVIESWLSIFAEQSRKANVIFLGGEPTLHPELSLAIKKANQLGYSSITVDTNGFLFHDILSKVTPDEVDYFSFSLDGATKKTNDMIRGEGVYDKCLAGVRDAVSKGFNTSLIFTVSEINIHELSLMPLLLNDLGINRFFIQVIGIRGKTAQSSNDQLQVPRDKWLKTIPLAAAAAASLGLKVTYPKVFLEKDETFECAGLVADNYFVFPNTRVYRCPLCEDYPIHSKTITDNRLIDTDRINEKDVFQLTIPEGCVMNRLIQPDNLIYDKDGKPEYKIACCLLKEEISSG